MTSLAEEEPQLDGVVYGTGDDVKNKVLEIKKGANSSSANTVHEGVLLEHTRNKLSIQDARYLRDLQWIKDKTIDIGTYSIVYKGQDHKSREVFAVKMEGLEDFEPREVVSWLHFHHDNIPELYGMVREGKNAFLFSEEIEEGLQLEEYLESTAYQEKRLEDMQLFISSVHRQVSSAVKHIHDRGYTHNDIIGKNVVVDKNGKVYVLDFGDALPIRDDDDDGIKLDWLCVRKIVEMGELAYQDQLKKRTEENNVLTRSPGHADYAPPKLAPTPVNASGDAQSRTSSGYFPPLAEGPPDQAATVALPISDTTSEGDFYALKSSLGNGDSNVTEAEATASLSSGDRGSQPQEEGQVTPKADDNLQPKLEELKIRCSPRKDSQM